MSSEVAVTFDDVTKRFPQQATTHWRTGVPWLAPRTRSTGALENVSLSVRRGESLGIIGPNGAGKTTLLKVLARILAPTSGRVGHTGRLSAMIELGLGFHPALTGRQNVIVAGTLLGVPTRAMRERITAIAEFAELEDVIDEPVREYSTGMVARLGFATATDLDADILVVDEVLAVGDHLFQEKCLQRIASQVERGTTLLFVSHEMPLVQSTCERTIVLRGGRIVDDGPTSRVIESYVGKRAAPPARGEPAASIEHLALAETVVEPHSAVQFDADVTIREPVDLDAIQFTLALPTFDPDLVIVDAKLPVPADHRGPGTYRLAGRTSEIPLVGGHMQLAATLLTSGKAALSRATHDFRMAGPIRALKPMYPLDVTAELHRAIGPDTERQAVGPALEQTDIALELSDVVKTFPTGRHGTSLLDALPGPLWQRGRRRMTALDQVSLVVGRGESVGVIGPNGAGKSSLLKCVAGLSGIDRGVIRTGGRVVPVLELGIGFRPDFTGWENLQITAALMGLENPKVSACSEAIVEFSGVGSSMDRPVREWSTGMRARLGFAIASFVQSDVLLIDELLSVGDLAFQRAAIAKVNQLCSDGAAVLLVSHDLHLITEVCDRAVRLEHGRIIDDGPAHDVVERYGGIGWSGGKDLGLGPVRVHDVELAESRIPTGGSARVSALVEVDAPAPHVRLELSIRDPAGAHDPELLTHHKVELYTIGMTVVANEGSLGTHGWYRLEADTGPLLGFGELHVVVAAVDSREGTYLAESWTTIVIADGRPTGDLPAAFEFRVEAEVTKC